MRFSIANYDVSVQLHARRPWTHFKIHNRAHIGVWHLVWGKLSIYVENATLPVYPTCGECGSTEIGEVSCGDEGWTVCPDCGTIEGEYIYLSSREIDLK